MDRAVAQHRVLRVAGVTMALATLALVGFAVVWPEVAKPAGETPRADGLAPETPMDWLAVPPYAAALAVCVWMLVRVRGRPDRRPLWVLLTFAVAWLLWRELPWDERLLNDANTFSWAKYLGRPDVPLWAQVVLGGGSILATVLLVVYVVRRGRVIGRILAEKVRSASAWVFGLGIGLLALAQAFDKYDTVDGHLGTNLAAWKATGWLGYAEESLEVLGPLALVMACLLAVVEEPRPAGRNAKAADGPDQGSSRASDSGPPGF
ncbi:MAG: hypothetical protein ISS74_01885 [Planctomycetes bacterium]|nr:hypothetical protein [Planctomycetota bacterium]